MNPQICPTCHTLIPPHAPGGFCPACLLRDVEEPAAAESVRMSLEQIAAAFPQWEIVRLIGQGGMGSVYQVRQPGLDRMVALKILSPELGRDPAFAERFAREARVLGKLNHPNLVTVFEHGESGGLFYLLMEYVDGVNLRQAMRAGRFTPEQALAIVPGICDALQAAHAQGIWHRDIKPENILLDARGGVKIADFGIARIVGDPQSNFTLTQTGGALGSTAYMAPEQLETPRDVDHRADIFSLGVVIYEMLTGELPLGRFPPPSRKAAVDYRIDEIVFRTLEKERELRQQSAAEVRTDVEGAAAVVAKTEPEIPKGKDVHSKLALGFFLAGIIGLLVLPQPVVLPGSMGYVPAEGLCAVAFLLAFVFGWFGWRERLGKLVVIGMGVSAVVGIAVSQYSYFEERGVLGARLQSTAERHQLEAEAIQLWGLWRATLPNDPNRTYVFKPVFEGVLPKPGPNVPCMLHLEDGGLFIPDEAFAAQLKHGGPSYAVSGWTKNSSQMNAERARWLKQVDAVVTMPDGNGIQLFSAQAFPVERKNFDTISPDEVVESVVSGLQRTDFQQSFIKSFSHREFIQVTANEGELFSFITPSKYGARLGIMELMGQSADGQGVKVRFRILDWYTAITQKTTTTRETVHAPNKVWEIANAGTGDERPEVIELKGELDAKFTEGGNYKAATAHVGGQPLFMIAGEGYMEGYCSWQSVGGDNHGYLGRIKFSVSDPNKAFIENRSYDLTRGRTFLVQKDGTLRQVPKRPEKVLDGDDLKKFIEAISPPDGGTSPAAPPAIPPPTVGPDAVMRAIIEAARDRNARVFQNGFSNRLQASIRQGVNLNGFGDFANFRFRISTQLGATRAEVVLEAKDDVTRRLSFPMIVENGAWKLDGWVAKPSDHQ